MKTPSSCLRQSRPDPSIATYEKSAATLAVALFLVQDTRVSWGVRGPMRRLPTTVMRFGAHLPCVFVCAREPGRLPYDAGDRVYVGVCGGPIRQGRREPERLA